VTVSALKDRINPIVNQHIVRMFRNWRVPFSHILSKKDDNQTPPFDPSCVNCG
jgi:hypothetical protein